MGKINVFEVALTCQQFNVSSYKVRKKSEHLFKKLSQQINLARRFSSSVQTTNVISREDRRLSNLESPQKRYEYNLTLFHKPSRKAFSIPVENFNKELKRFTSRYSDLSNCQEKDVENYFTNITYGKSKNLDEDENLNTKTVSDLVWREVKLDKNFMKPFLVLAKIRLTSFVVMSSIAGYALAPGSFDFLTFLACSTGVLCTSSAANALNQFFETPYDSQMSRTMNRPIVRGCVKPQQAVAFALMSGSLGVFLLLTGTNSLTAALGLSNIILYSMVYTPMKRTNIANTWVGSIVGAIPPMMGWVAATGHLDTGAWLLGGVLYAWQFPHFCALSWNLQSDYSRAGYRMMSVVNPELCRRVALKYSIGLVGLSFLFPICGVTTWMFAVDALPLNSYLTYLAWKFYRRGDSASSRNLFKFSLLYLPLVLIFLIISKKSFGSKDSTEIKNVQ